MKPNAHGNTTTLKHTRSITLCYQTCLMDTRYVNLARVRVFIICIIMDIEIWS